MSRNPLVVDIVVAVVIVALVLIIEPGVAVAAILALVLLAVCGISYLVGRRARRRDRGAGSRRRAPRPPAAPGRPRRRY